MRIGALSTQTDPLARGLNHIGEPAEPPRVSVARPGAEQCCSAWGPAQTTPGLGRGCSIAAHPPASEDPPAEAVTDWDTLAQPQPEYVFGRQVQR
jgi:hypothetical protein